MIESPQPTDQAHASIPTIFPNTWPYNELIPPRRGLLVVLSGPSASGKDAIIAALANQDFPITKIVTATARSMRPGEIQGKDYHFLSLEEFYHWRDDGRLLEWAEVYGIPYGTPVAGIHDALLRGETVLLKIDVKGAAQVKLKAPNAVFIFLGPGSFDELVARLRKRGTETEEAFNRRVEEARDELRQITQYDYVVVNRQGELASAVTHVRAIIEAERLRVRPREIDV